MLVVFKKDTGEIIEAIQDDQDVEVYYKFYPEEFRNNLGYIHVDELPKILDNYKVMNNELVKRHMQELYELKKYKRVLTEEERLLEKLKPTQEEVRKAEQTIEILTLIQEVI